MYRSLVLNRVALAFCLLSCVLIEKSTIVAMQKPEGLVNYFPKNEFGNPLMIDRKTLEIGYAIPDGSILWRNRNKKWMFVFQDRGIDGYAQSHPVPKGVAEKINYALFPRDFSIPKDLQAQEVMGPDDERIFKIVSKDGVAREIIIYAKNEYNEETFEMLYPLSSELINTINQEGSVLLNLSRSFGAYAFSLKKDLSFEYIDLVQLFKLEKGFKVKIVYRYGWPCEIVEYVDGIEACNFELPASLVEDIKQHGSGELLVERASGSLNYLAILHKYPESKISAIYVQESAI